MNRWTISCALILHVALNIHSASAQTSPNCDAISPFISIVDKTDWLLTAGTRLPAAHYATLKAQVRAYNPAPMRAALVEIGRAQNVGEPAAYLRLIDHFLTQRDSLGTRYAQRQFAAPDFRAMQTRMRNMVDGICDDGAKSVLREVNHQDLEDAGIANFSASDRYTTRDPNRPAGKSSLEKTAAQPWFYVRTLDLLSVFLVLAALINALLVLNLALKYARAIRLDRYSCQIPATINLGGVQVAGIIDIIGNRGLSFVASDGLNTPYKDSFILGKRVEFLTQAAPLAAVLTKAFDGSAGFRLKKQLPKSHLNALLEQSITLPKRKIEMPKRRAPKRAPPQKSMRAKQKPASSPITP